MAYIVVDQPAHAGTPDADLFDSALGAFQDVTLLAGGRGNDTYVLYRDVHATVAENAGEGTDTILLTRSRASFVLPAHVERFGFTFEIPGSPVQGRVAVFTGNDLDNFIEYGLNDDDDQIDGRGGRDTMAGGGGDDTYFVDDAGDVVIEAAGGGNDKVVTRVAFVLGAHVEALQVLAAVAGTGNALDNLLEGSQGAQVLSGLAGNDTLAGEGGEDRLLGGEGNDSLEGGEGNDSLDGGAGGDSLRGGTGRDTLAGGAGSDVYFISGAGDATDVVVEAAGAANGSDLVVVSGLSSWVLAANVERLRFEGSAAFQATGNALDNHLATGSGNDTLEGGAGNDVLEGGAGADRMSGGAGDDTYVVQSAADQVVEAAGGGADLVIATVSLALGAHVENLALAAGSPAALVATGNALANVLTGNEFANFLHGLEGNDLLDGRGGADRMHGGAGDDTYVVDNAADLPAEISGQGRDLVRASVSFVLPVHVEDLVLTGGVLDRLAGTGNDLANRITGDAGANLLDGRLGLDTLSGGVGDDTYVVDAGNDVVVELAGGGRDLVMVLAQAVLAANVEDGLLLGGATTLTGNGLDNVLTGNAGINVLSGLGGNDQLSGGAGEDALAGGAGNDLLDGGRGADTLDGGAGNDTYLMDALDTLIELAGGGTDLVRALDVPELDLLPADTASGLRHVEDVELLGSSVKVIGNALANRITGNARANDLAGGAGNDTLVGGAGADTLAGGAGSDSYSVDDAGDRVLEQDTTAGGGVDVVSTAVSFALDDVDSAGVESLVAAAGAGAIDLSGNSRANTLVGSAGANALAGGAGNDSLWGAEGNDRLDGGAGNDSLAGGEGNDLLDVLVSGAGFTLAGATGTDTMAGGAGDDTYGVDASSDQIVEAAGLGRDLVVVRIGDGTGAALTYTLGANLEDGFLLAASNVTRLDGNALDNALYGNAAANTLNGGAGNDYLDGDGTSRDPLVFTAEAADTMTGGAGDDTYVVNAAGDTVTEAAGGGTDTILLYRAGAADAAAGSYSLAAAGRLEVENLTIRGAVAGAVFTGNDRPNAFVSETGTALRFVGGGGDDTAVYTDVTTGTVGLDGGAGTDRLSVKGIDASITVAVNAVERVELGLNTGAGGASVSFLGSSLGGAPAAPVIALVGGSTAATVDLEGLLAQMTRFEMTDTAVSVELAYAAAPGSAGVELRLEDAGDPAVPLAAGFGVSTALQRLSIASALGDGSGNLLQLLGATITTVGVSGAASLALSGVDNTQRLEVTGFTGRALSLDMDAGASAARVAVGNAAFELRLDTDVTALTLEALQGAEPSQVSIREAFAPTLALTLATAQTGAPAAGFDGDTLQVAVGSIAAVNANAFLGSLLFTGHSAAGEGITFTNTADKSVAGAAEYEIYQTFWSLRFGAGDDQILMGNNLWQETEIDGAEGDDTLTAVLDDLDARTGHLALRGIEQMNFSVAAAGTGPDDPGALVDGTFIEDADSGTVITLGGPATAVLVMEGMRVSEIDASAFSGDLFVFLRDAMGQETGVITPRVTGGAGDDALVGAGSDDTLEGGPGADTLTGGGGADTFVFTRPDAATVVTDFQSGQDRLAFDDGDFTALAGGIAAGNVRFAAAAADADDFVLYDVATGTLRFDADGSGAGAAVVVAQLGAGTPVALADFVLA